MEDWKIFLILIAVFLAAFWLPVENVRFQNGLIEGFALLKEYARDHVLLCLIPAFFIAGAISVFVSKASVIKYFGARADVFCIIFSREKSRSGLSHHDNTLIHCC
jgi:uncharacterized membrane protein YraQ (UPF0718 family)